MKGKKTMIFVLILEILGFLETFGWTDYLNSKTAGAVIMVIGLVTGILRIMTNSPVFSSIPGGGNTGGNKRFRPQEKPPKNKSIGGGGNTGGNTGGGG